MVKSGAGRLCSYLLLAFMCGCGGSERPGLVKVTGTVTLDGKPLEGAQVSLQFVTDATSKYQRPSSALTDAQGKFMPATYGKDDGLPVGKYKVAVQKREVVGQLPADFNEENPEATPVTYKWITPRGYADVSTSGLEIEVTSSGMKPESLDLTTGGAQPEIERIGGPNRPQSNIP